MRLRRRVAFDRLLARLFAHSNAPWMLKGGYTFELRLGGRAWATKDLDLSVPDLHRLTAVNDAEALAPSALIREWLQDVAADLGDGFAFRIGMPIADLDAVNTTACCIHRVRAISSHLVRQR